MVRAMSKMWGHGAETECGIDYPGRKSERKEARSRSNSKWRAGRDFVEADKRRDSLCWVDVFTEEYFNGRLTRLWEGDHADMKKPGSIIVGPDAVACCTDPKTKRMRQFASRTVCPSVSMRGNPASIRIEVIPAAMQMRRAG